MCCRKAFLIAIADLSSSKDDIMRSRGCTFAMRYGRAVDFHCLTVCDSVIVGDWDRNTLRPCDPHLNRFQIR